MNQRSALDEREHGLTPNDSFANVGTRRAALLVGAKFTH